MTSIVLGYEGSECADRAVELVRAMPWEAGTSVTLETAIPDARAIRSAWGSLVLGDPAQLERVRVSQAAPRFLSPVGYGYADRELRSHRSAFGRTKSATVEICRLFNAHWNGVHSATMPSPTSLASEGSQIR